MGVKELHYYVREGFNNSLAVFCVRRRSQANEHRRQLELA